MEKRIPITQIATDEQFYFIAGQLERYLTELSSKDNFIRSRYRQEILININTPSISHKCDLLKKHITKLMSRCTDKLPSNSEFDTLVSNFFAYEPETNDNKHMFMTGLYSDIQFNQENE